MARLFQIKFHSDKKFQPLDSRPRGCIFKNSYDNLTLILMFIITNICKLKLKRLFTVISHPYHRDLGSGLAFEKILRKILRSFLC